MSEIARLTERVNELEYAIRKLIERANALPAGRAQWEIDESFNEPAKKRGRPPKKVIAPSVMGKVVETAATRHYNQQVQQVLITAAAEHEKKVKDYLIQKVHRIKLQEAFERILLNNYFFAAHAETTGGSGAPNAKALFSKAYLNSVRDRLAQNRTAQAAPLQFFRVLKRMDIETQANLDAMHRVIREAIEEQMPYAIITESGHISNAQRRQSPTNYKLYLGYPEQVYAKTGEKSVNGQVITNDISRIGTEPFALTEKQREIFKEAWEELQIPDEIEDAKEYQELFKRAKLNITDEYIEVKHWRNDKWKMVHDFVVEAFLKSVFEITEQSYNSLDMRFNPNAQMCEYQNNLYSTPYQPQPELTPEPKRKSASEQEQESEYDPFANDTWQPVLGDAFD